MELELEPSTASPRKNSENRSSSAIVSALTSTSTIRPRLRVLTRSITWRPHIAVISNTMAPISPATTNTMYLNSSAYRLVIFIHTLNGTSTISENSTRIAENFAHQTPPWNSEKVVDETIAAPILRHSSATPRSGPYDIK